MSQNAGNYQESGTQNAGRRDAHCPVPEYLARTGLGMLIAYEGEGAWGGIYKGTPTTVVHNVLRTWSGQDLVKARLGLRFECKWDGDKPILTWEQVRWKTVAIKRPTRFLNEDGFCYVKECRF